MIEPSEAAKAKFCEIVNAQLHTAFDPWRPERVHSGNPTAYVFARFIQQVSDAAKEARPFVIASPYIDGSKAAAAKLEAFILHDRDPLEAALKDANENGGCTYADWAKALPEALAKRGLKIVEDKS